MWVWSGFFVEEDIEPELAHSSYPDKASLKRELQDAFLLKREAEKSWPERTDCDRLDEAFVQLASEHVIALHNAGFDLHDGHDLVGDIVDANEAVPFRGYCFYHAQNVESAQAGKGLFLSFGAFGDADTRQLGHKIVATLKEQNLEVSWDGDVTTRILITPMSWLRRFPPRPFSLPLGTGEKGNAAKS